MKRNYNNQIRHRSHEATNIIEIEEVLMYIDEYIQLSKREKKEILDNMSS